jgi:hypothetical protein
MNLNSDFLHPVRAETRFELLDFNAAAKNLPCMFIANNIDNRTK